MNENKPKFTLGLAFKLRKATQKWLFNACQHDNYINARIVTKMSLAMESKNNSYRISCAFSTGKALINFLLGKPFEE